MNHLAPLLRSHTAPVSKAWVLPASVIVIVLITIGVLQSSAQTLTVLYSFATRTGALPSSGVIRDAAGNLYGTTWFGGTDQWGTVFEVTSGAKETVLYNFTGGKDGKYALFGFASGFVGQPLWGDACWGGPSREGPF